MAAKVVINLPIELMNTEQQEQVLRMSRSRDVFIRDVNGEEWQVLDLTTDDDKPEDRMRMVVKMDKKIKRKKEIKKVSTVEFDDRILVNQYMLARDRRMTFQTRDVDGHRYRVFVRIGDPVSVCYLHRTDEDRKNETSFYLYGFGISVKKPGDAFDAHTAAKYAIRSALRRFDPGIVTRVEIWKEFDDLYRFMSAGKIKRKGEKFYAENANA